ncbi:MAG TPA: 50S ribosomal protein L6 [Bacteroidales bacterium]|nr:50S ribosomal protein L6 [Bacteroidales bacterium]HPB26009.1 50S ribosomal protein L6 [Bacteroidales bacterium]HPI30095.1 50S ribosomal protein L6 [Bacteroidales bacterium]HQN16356.1 50S ribosomal protein L6 [Bacteroidales bacterium]HQP15948.1 50S ribosomal protein L6 [Bacteroidales bacterium]
MSRIGKLPIALPQNVQLNVSDDNIVTVKGPKGELKQKINPSVKIKVENNHIILERENDEARAYHGLYRALVSNMVHGVSEGFKLVQEIIGVGYKADAQNNLLELSLGYSHNIFMEMPPEVKVTTINERGKPPTIILESIDKQLLGQVASKIRSLRKPEPYKGKGIRFQNEVLRKKAGKSAVQK